MFSTVTEVRKFCTDRMIKMIDFKTIDIDGRWRHVTIPVERLDEDTMQYGIGFDGSNYGYAPVEKSDMMFIPDLSSSCMDPFVDIPTLSMIGNVFVIHPEGNMPFDQYPRNVALRAEEYLRESQIADSMIIGPEFEFHILEHVSYECKPQRVSFELNTPQAEWNSGQNKDVNSGYQIPNKCGYHITPPHDINYGLRGRMCLLLEDWGVKVKYHHHEVGGPGQQEIEVELGQLTEMADKTMIIKYIVKNAAVSENKTATFMPKPFFAEAGNGMHVHMLLMKESKPVFYDKAGYSGLSREAHWFMGGLLKHAKSLCALTNPTTNSFKRLVPGYEAPATIGYATSNRSAIIRIPAYVKSPEAKRFELRNPDATCNPYYAYAAILMAGIDGMLNKIDPHESGWGPFDFNLYNLSAEEQEKLTSLPKSLDEALDALEEDNEYLTHGGVFPKKLLDTWIMRKRAEIDTINKIPHPAEFAHYFDL
ncbi:MAG: type I glutamate--ammonia ligase [Desulfitobacteriaceae bacterium]|nr:type I glutamate--ammonia ligase [Desulfitobacteriaceae bacterium]MDD4347018.1 type I glutamate--ammonia ligase [Desulfitobacteriaceae bacterium]MDD4402090.1 type I glutamate--ammonia ligase [Desulfitobacteriaceae bacterium]